MDLPIMYMQRAEVGIGHVSYGTCIKVMVTGHFRVGSFIEQMLPVGM